MPLVQVNVSVQLTGEQIQAIASELIAQLSEASKKAPEKFMVDIRGGANICFANSFEPAGYVTMASISGATQEFNDVASQIFATVLEPFGVPSSRLFCTFSQLEKTHWAKAGKTYATLGI